MCFFLFFKADILSVPLLCLYDFQSLIEAEKQSSKSVWCLEMGSRLRSYTRRQLIRYTKNIWRIEVSKGAKQKSGNNGGVQLLKWTKICYFIFGAKIQKNTFSCDFQTKITIVRKNQTEILFYEESILTPFKTLTPENSN